MFLLLCLTTLLFESTIAIQRPYYHIEKSKEYFDDFIITHGKCYEHEDEKRTRFDIFKQNLIHINYLNAFSPCVHGVTQFSDLSHEEFLEQYNSCLAPLNEGFKQSQCKVITDADLISNQAPPTLDYREKNYVTPVKQQDHCGCCWAFASVGSLEALYAMKYGHLESLSAQQLMDCLPSSGHCARGNVMTTALSELKMTAGVESEKDYPYVDRDLPCQLKAPKAIVRVTGCYNFILKTEEKLKEALYLYGPIAIGIDASPIKHYWQGIVDARTCPPGQLGHAVLLVGYGTEGGRDFWIIKNSWGTIWGPEQGYVRFARGQNVCGMLNGYAAAGMIA